MNSYDISAAKASLAKARARAKKAASDTDRAFWQSIIRDWLKTIRQLEQQEAPR